MSHNSYFSGHKASNELQKDTKSKKIYDQDLYKTNIFQIVKIKATICMAVNPNF